MMYLILDLMLFLLVLFFVVPGLMICARSLRDYVHTNRKHVQWHKSEPEKLVS